ncbi:Ppx/GppA family phosphatase [Patulibacter sp.]|uniref:Ppx/GppA phosphatase family protein n=1 Tax=Patulibacter sp. TaxID=1912859 RepID=UPI00271E087C|nr:Ppx/GppA family phosphatase [Patulibacter sp.]MDO9409266.1 Ppx/GppA family phosphatase [Patulibacter sp.]
MRLAAVDLGSNSTRLLIADLEDDGRLTEVLRRATVTRLGAGVDRTGRLDDRALDRVRAELLVVHGLLAEHGVERAVGVLTSAVRDAENGAELTEHVRSLGIDARTIPGEREAELTFLGATGGRPPEDRPVAVVDVGGGSTELVVGRPGSPEFAVSTQAGVVRHGERHLHHDPPASDELVALADDARDVFSAAVPEDVRASVGRVIAVAGTATSCAAMIQELDPYDVDRVHGFVLALAEVDELTARLAQMTEAERREVVGLQADRAPTIVAGCVLLSVALRTFGVKECEVSEHDILRGAIIAAATGEF